MDLLQIKAVLSSCKACAITQPYLVRQSGDIAGGSDFRNGRTALEESGLKR